MPDKPSKPIDQLRQDLVVQAELPGGSLELRTTWGLFSPRAVDEGSRLLLEVLPVEIDEHAVDLGCGYGVLGLAIARQAPSGIVHLVDKDFVAVEYARANALRNGLSNVQVYLSNGLDAVPRDFRPGLVVSNLPAKVGNEMFYLMFHDARQMMPAGGRMVVVTLSGLRRFVQRAFGDVFGNYRKLRQGSHYTVSMAEVLPVSD